MEEKRFCESQRKWDTQLKRRFRYKKRQYHTIGLASKVVNLFLAQLKNTHNTIQNKTIMKRIRKTQQKKEIKRFWKNQKLKYSAMHVSERREQKRDTSHSSKDTSIAKWFYVCQSIKAHKTQSGFVCSEMCVCACVWVFEGGEPNMNERQRMAIERETNG